MRYSDAVRKARKLSPNAFRRVVIHWKENLEGTEHIVLAKEAKIMQLACHRLHVDPGINPHTRTAASPATSVTIEPLGDNVDTKWLYATGPFWWSTPDLQDNDNPKGAVVFLSDLTSQA